MDRLKIETYIKGYEAAAPGRTLSVFSADEQYELAKLALQSLSQEAVRDEALEEAARECMLAASREEDHDAQRARDRTRRNLAAAIRALKREPNAALGMEHPNAAGAGPAPAAPDVAEGDRLLQSPGALR